MSKGTDADQRETHVHRDQETRAAEATMNGVAEKDRNQGELAARSKKVSVNRAGLKRPVNA